MKIMSTAVVAGAALLASAALTIAQDKNAPGGAGGGASGPSAGAAPGEGGGSGAVPAERATPGKGQATDRDRGPRANAPAKEPGRSAEPKERTKERPAAQAPERDKKAEQGDQDRKKAAEPRDQDRNRKQAEPGRQDKQDNKRATERGQDKQDKQPSASGKQQPDSPKKAEGGRDAQQAQKHEELRSARTRLSSDQRSDMRSKFDRRGARAGDVKFTVRVGIHVPRRVRLYAIPAAVLAIVPAYSAYRYVVVEDEIVIIDPATYEVVDVIDERSQQAATRSDRVELRLSSEQRAMVLDSIGRDYPPADVRIRLALGAEIPRSVELHAFPDVVIDRVPDLRRFRFIVAEREVVIVEPRDRSIALVIEQR